MAFEVRTTDRFEKEAKRLHKKYPSLKYELIELQRLLIGNPSLGTPLGKNFYN